MLYVLLSFTDSVAEVVQGRVEMDFFSAITGGSVVAALAFLLLKGNIAMIKNYSDQVVSYKNQNNDLVHENGSLHQFLTESRQALAENQIHLEACRKENEISNKRIETMALEILDLKGEVTNLKRQVQGKEKLD